MVAGTTISLAAPASGDAARGPARCVAAAGPGARAAARRSAIPGPTSGSTSSGGIRGPAALSRAVDQGQAAVAFALHPVSVADLMAIADAGGIMPPKSTWFEPKLRDGLLSHLI